MNTAFKFGVGLSLLVACWAGVVGIAGQAGKTSGAQINPSNVRIPELLDFKLQRLDLPARAVGSLTTTVSLDGVDYALNLHPHWLRSDAFELLAQGEDGRLRRIEPPPSRTYRGAVEGLPGSRVAASLRDGQLSAIILLPDGPTWTIQPAADFDSHAARGAHVVYRSEDVLLLGDYRCGTEESSARPPTTLPHTATAADTGLILTEIAVDADFEFFQRRGHSLERVVQDIEDVINNVGAIYQGQVGTTYEITAIVVRTAEPDPYSSTNPSVLLRSEFLREWNGNPELRNLPRDVTHLMTGKDLDGNVIGIAFTGTMCVPLTAYGLSQSLFTVSAILRACLTAHELGHNWNALHCDDDIDCGIMCSRVGGCGQGCSRFGSRSLGAITNIRDLRACFDPLADPIDPPFVESFPTEDLDRTRWIFIKGASINADAVDAPSPPYALNLSAAGPGEFQDDEIRSNFIRLGAADRVTISFFTQHRGVESGEALVIEYFAWDQFSNIRWWKELGRITSDGTDQSGFTFHSFTRSRSDPNQRDAFHDGFRIRFRSEVDEPDDNWAIDDVEVITAP